MAGLANPQVIIDNIAYFIKPNSFKETKSGYGEVTTRAVASGTTVAPVHTLNLEEAFSEFEFMMVTDTTSVELRDDLLRDRLAEKTIEGVLEDGSVRTYSNAVLSTDPEVGFGSDGEITFTFKGAQVK